VTVTDETEEEWQWLIADEAAPWQVVAVGKKISAIEWKRVLQEPQYEALFQAKLKEYETRFRAGEKYAAFAALTASVMWCRPLPSWAGKEIWLAYNLYCKGQLRSWDDVFGRPFPGKRRKGITTRAKDLVIWSRARQLYETEDFYLDDGLWEQLAKEFDMGTANIKSAFRRIESAHEAAASPFQLKLKRKPRRRRHK
jgi:hypothetical protein